MRENVILRHDEVNVWRTEIGGRKGGSGQSEPCQKGVAWLGFSSEGEPVSSKLTSSPRNSQQHCFLTC